MPRILVADDEKNIREVISYALEAAGFEVQCVQNGKLALEELAQKEPDLLILDVLMPELDGLSVCRELRQNSKLPIIFLSSRGEEADRVGGLEIGGDDYLTKPFSPRELVSRVRAVLRRVPADVSPQLQTFQNLVLDHESFELRIDQTRVDLTPTEFRLLYALVSKPGRVFSRSQLISIAYDGDHYVSERTIDTHIRRVRAKLRPWKCDPIETVHGLGYKTP